MRCMYMNYEENITLPSNEAKRTWTSLVESLNETRLDSFARSHQTHRSSSLPNVHFRYSGTENRTKNFPKRATLASRKSFVLRQTDNVLSRAQTTHDLSVDYRNNDSLVSVNSVSSLMFTQTSASVFKIIGPTWPRRSIDRTDPPLGCALLSREGAL